MAVLMAALAAARASAQLPSASAAELGLGGRSAAVARGFSAVAGNPAGLGMPRASRVTATVLPLGVGCALGPVTCGDVAEWDGRETPDAVREAWLQGIERSGHQHGRFEGSVTLAAASVGLFGFQISSLALGGADLNPDAAEFLLFGNAGRTNEPREFHFAGSSLDGFAVTTAAVGAGIPLEIEIGDAPGQSFAVGATLKYTLGNALWVQRDLGSFFSEELPETWLRLPIVQARGGTPLSAGGGIGLDVGFQWDAPAWAFGLVVRNVVNSFRWDMDELVFRPGTALLKDGGESDFVPRPAQEAPPALLDAVRAFRFGPRATFGFGHALDPRTSFYGQVDVALGETSDRATDAEAGVGIEHRLLERLPLRAHASMLDGGLRLGGGAGLRVGNVHLSGAGSFSANDGLRGPSWMLAVSFGGS